MCGKHLTVSDLYRHARPIAAFTTNPRALHKLLSSLYSLKLFGRVGQKLQEFTSQAATPASRCLLTPLPAYVPPSQKKQRAGYSCHKLHFVPTQEDDAREDNMHDCFGRERSGAMFLLFPFLFLLLLAAPGPFPCQVDST